METVLKTPGRSTRELILRLEQESGTRISLCYQCGKCTAGCPAALDMDYGPRQVIRLLQLGLAEEALRAGSIWICATCNTCSSRCPRGVDIAALMDALRRQALARGIVTDRQVATFNQVFLNQVRRFGRLFDAGLLMEYNLRTGQLLKDVEMGLPMLKRGKVRLLPDRIKDRKQLEEIFAQVRNRRGEP